MIQIQRVFGTDVGTKYRLDPSFNLSCRASRDQNVVDFLASTVRGLMSSVSRPYPPQREINYDSAVNMLLRSMSMAQGVPFAWGYVDKPADGTLLLLFLPPNAPFPTDGIRFQDSEVKYTLPAGSRELEVHEIKFGFIPGSTDSNASRVRRRYRLSKGGHAQLVLVHYTRGPPTHIQPALMNQPIRGYPLRSVNEPSVYVTGEKMGQKVYPPGSGPMHAGPGPASMPPATIGLGMNFNQQQAMVAQQNNTMETLERRRERERERERAARERSGSTSGRPPPQQQQREEDDSGDEVDQISTRTLAVARYKRNHDWMNDVFRQAAYGSRTAEPQPTPYSIFSKDDMDEKAKLQEEIEALQFRSSQRRADRTREAQTDLDPADMSMSSVGEPIAV
ncbi:hypothetical protein B0H34DRAFT_445707 [Crassisporium funariophilum]|nr:hypothetical protein B0H34DRAFT_445707 [Crassisporium funariophilum]